MRTHLYPAPLAVDDLDSEVEDERLLAVLTQNTPTPLGVFSAGMSIEVLATDGPEHRIVALARVGETRITARLPRSVLVIGPHSPRTTRCDCGRETYADRRRGRCIVCTHFSRRWEVV